MSTFDIRPDAPGLLRVEALNVSIKFERTGPSTGRVSWNIPTPAAGCTADNQAYCGMLVTLDTSPASLAKAPTNGKMYASDPTADANLFAGDKIDTAFVIGAFYEDRTTIFFDVTGLKPNTPYFVTGYPVDCQLRYFVSGVHAYSQDFKGSGTDSTSGTQVVALAANANPTSTSFNIGDPGNVTPPPPPGGVQLTDVTGLVCGAFYDIQCQIGVIPAPRTPYKAGECVPQPGKYTITVDGCDASTYQDLIDELNEQFALLTNPPQGPLPPNANAFYWNAVSQKLFQWDGFEHVEVPVIVQATDPSIVIIGSYWYNPVTDVLQVWNGLAWVVVVVIEHSTDPQVPVCDKTYWCKSPAGPGYLWNGTTWCEKTTYVTTTDPSLQLPAPCGSFWYDTDDFFLYRWNDTLGIWQVTTAIQFDEDPNALSNGVHWFDETNLLLKTWNVPLPGWNTEANVAVQETAPTTPAIGKFWYNPSTQELFQWNGAAWIPMDVLVFAVDPTVRASCDLWWDTSETAGYATISYTDIPPVTPATVPAVLTGNYDFTLSVDGTAPVDYTVNVLVTDSMTAIAAKMEAVLLMDVTAIGTGFVISSNTTSATSAVLVTEPTTGANPDLFAAIDAGLTGSHTTVSTPGTDLADVLKVWDVVNVQWDTVAVFYQQAIDPTLPPALVDGDLWMNPTTGDMYVWQNICFKLVECIDWPTDPTTTIPDGTVWFDGTSWFVRLVGVWVSITPVVTTLDPTVLPVGTFWFNTTLDALNQWNGIAWVNVTYSTSPFTPAAGSNWYDTSTNTLMVWDGTTWVPGIPLAMVELDCNGNLLFTDLSKGSLSFIAVGDITLLRTLLVPFRILNPCPGTDGVSDQPAYAELGVGTDGSNDERFKLMNEIRYELGYPVIDVELTQEQLDFCVSRAIEELRGKSGICYRHGFFFMRISAETQRYLLTNKVSGMNKIVNVQGVYRLTSAFLSSAHGAGVYGQIVLQHLYNMGTFDLLSYHIIADYVKLMEILFAARVTFTWDEHSRELWLHHRFPFTERMVLIECSTERVEQEIIADRWCRSWIRRFSVATAQEILAGIRGKFSTLPGAGGGVTLNAAELRLAATEMKTKLEQEVFDYQADKPEDYGMGAQFIFG